MNKNFCVSLHQKDEELVNGRNSCNSIGPFQVRFSFALSPLQVRSQETVIKGNFRLITFLLCTIIIEMLNYYVSGKKQEMYILQKE